MFKAASILFIMMLLIATSTVEGFRRRKIKDDCNSEQIAIKDKVCGCMGAYSNKCYVNLKRIQFEPDAFYFNCITNTIDNIKCNSKGRCIYADCGSDFTCLQQGKVIDCSLVKD